MLEESGTRSAELECDSSENVLVTI